MGDKPMDSYYCTVRSVGDDNRMQWRFSADNFAHAEEQCQQHLEGDMEIITIERDYKV
jgi:hypothetical protein